MQTDQKDQRRDGDNVQKNCYRGGRCLSSLFLFRCLAL